MGIIGTARRGHRELYAASKVLVYLAFLLGLTGIYAGVVRLLCYPLQCPSTPLPVHRDLILSVFPLLIIGVGSLLSPAYFTYPPIAILSYLLAAAGILYASTQIADLILGALLLRLVSLLLLATAFLVLNIDLMARQKTKGFLRLMNIPYIASSALLSVYPALEIYRYLTNRYSSSLGWDPMGVYVIPMIFAVMMRTDPFARRWYREELSPYIFGASILPAIGGTALAIGITFGIESIVLATVIVYIIGLSIAGVLIIPRRSGVKNLAEYEVSVKLAFPWGLLGLLASIGGFPGSMDLSVHAIALGFVGNIFLAYSRFLLPYRPFTPGIARSIDRVVIVSINIGILLRIVYSVSPYIAGLPGIEGAPGIIDIVSLLSSAIIGGSILAVLIRILGGSATPRR